MGGVSGVGEVGEVGGGGHCNPEECFDSNLLSLFPVDVAISWIPLEGRFTEFLDHSYSPFCWVSLVFLLHFFLDVLAACPNPDQFLDLWVLMIFKYVSLLKR